MDVEIFTLLKEQVFEVFILLLDTRKFAVGKGLQQDVEKIESDIVESNHILSLVNSQLFDLKNDGITNRIELFETI